jgi:hypothetical protein
MTNLNKKLKIIFQVILGLVLLGLIVLVFRLRPAGESTSPGIQDAYPGPGETDAGDALLLTGTEAPYPLPGQEATQMVENNKPILPPCEFPLTSSEEIVPNDALANFQFSEPQIIYSSATGVGIADWLPDGESLLLTRETTYGKQIIETFNIISGESHIYAERHYAGGKPIWIEELNAVAFTTFVQDHEELWLSYGDPNQTELLSPDIFSLSLTKIGNKLLFFSPSRGDQPILVDLNNKFILDFDISLQDLAYSKFPPGIHPPIPGYTFQIAAQPSKKNIIFFGGGLLYVTNVETQKSCEIDLGIGSSGPNWANLTQWSNDGRYLAMMIISVYPGSIVPINKLMILDTITGEKYDPEIAAPYIYEFVWSPGSNNLLALGNVGAVDGRAKMGLFLIDVNAKTVTRLFPDLFFGGGGNGNLAWAQNKIALDCTSWPQNSEDVIEGRVCLIDVQEGK